MRTKSVRKALKRIQSVKNGYAIVNGDCLAKMRLMPDACVDSIVTDPPYGIEFMGAAWDSPTKMNASGPQSKNWHDNGGKNPFARRETPRYAGKKLGNKAAEGRAFQAWCEAWLREALRVLKPGGHIVAFGGSRMWHRLASAIEDAGFEIRDSLMFMHGQGFPKSMNIGKAIDKTKGLNRKVVATVRTKGGGMEHVNKANAKHGYMDKTYSDGENVPDITAPACEESVRWEGWGTALKPAMEPIVLARKSFSEKTAAKNVLKHGTGAINVDMCRVRTNDNLDGGAYTKQGNRQTSLAMDSRNNGMNNPGKTTGKEFVQPDGRWPANVLLEHSTQCCKIKEHGIYACVPHCPVRMLDSHTGTLKSGKGSKIKAAAKGYRANALGAESRKPGTEMVSYADTGGASRFFYTSKPKKRERHAGLPDGVENKHPTLKSINLMRWLCRLVTPEGGIILDPFVGSGTTACAGALEGFRVIGIERKKSYSRVAHLRAKHWSKQQSVEK